MSRNLFTTFVAVIALSITSAALQAQPLAERVPGDAILYVGWAGAGQLGEEFERSHFKGLLDEPGIRDILDQYLPKLLEIIREEEPEAAEVIRIIQALGTPLARHTTAFYFAGVDLQGDMPSPRAALLCQAGDDADAMLQQIRPLIDMIRRDIPFPLHATVHDGLLIVAIGYAQPADAVAAAADQSLAQNARFRQAAGRVSQNPAAMVYADSEATQAMIGRLIGQFAPPDMQQAWPRVQAALHLEGIRSFVMSGAFEDRQWSRRWFVEAPAPRQGTARLMEGQPITEAMLRQVPQNATSFSALSADLAGMLQLARAVVDAIDPEMGQQMQEGLDEASRHLGIDIQRDLLEALGPEWIVYNDPHIGGRGGFNMGTVFVNRLRKPAEAQRSLLRIATEINESMGMGWRERPPVREVRIGGEQVHTFGMFMMGPSWTIRGDYLYVAFYPQVAASAAAHATAGGPSVRDNPTYAATRQRLGADQAGSVAFADLPRLLPDNYQMLLMFSQVMNEAAQDEGIDLPVAAAIPPLHVLLRHMSPAASATWADDAGIHGRAIAPMPGADLSVIEPQAAVGLTGVMTAALMPALHQARVSAQRTASMSNLRQIALGAIMYAHDHNGRAPDSYAELITGGYISGPDVFLSPASNTTVPPEIRQRGQDQVIANWVVANSDYAYVGAGRNVNQIRNPATTILAYEEPHIHGGRGMGVAFWDGHVEWLSVEDGVRMVHEQNQRE